MSVIKGSIHSISGPTAVARGLTGVRMHTVCRVGGSGLLGEVIRIQGDLSTLQVYEDTLGLSVGEEVVSIGGPLTVVLGPGLLSNIFDGIQRPLGRMRASGADFIAKGFKAEPLDMDRVWRFSAVKRPGEAVSSGDIIGTVQETERIVHAVMVPPEPDGGVKSGVISEIRDMDVSGSSPVCRLEDGSGIGLYHEWPVRIPRPYACKLPPYTPFSTGQRVFDTLFPVARGGIAVVPGGFGTGKTVVEQTIAKFGLSDVVVYIGCGERGNEMTEMLSDFPVIKDPATGLPLSRRTVIVVNTSNMPVAAREASIFTGVTIAEYYRDMGYNVAVLADSISRWAEALREISSRLEEMPGEEGFPPYLATLLGVFYERAGKVKCLGGDGRKGSVTVISAVSPPGGDFSEPVTQASLRFAGAFWALDPDLANRRHFPALNWQSSFSLYSSDLEQWFADNVSPEAEGLRNRFLRLLEQGRELKEVVQIIGVEALQEADRLSLDIAKTAAEAFLKQSAFNEADAYNPYEKQHWMLRVIFAYFDEASAALKKGVFVEKIIESKARTAVLGMKDIPASGFAEKAKDLINGIRLELGGLSTKDAGRI